MSSLNRLKEKLTRSEPVSVEDSGGGCLEEALKLYEKYRGGLLYWIGDCKKIGLDFSIQHTYFVPPGAKDSDIALNQADNGFSQYPKLTVAEVKILGKLQNINVVRGLVGACKRS
jgi:hypothetical protein